MVKFRGPAANPGCCQDAAGHHLFVDHPIETLAIIDPSWHATT